MKYFWLLVVLISILGLYSCRHNVEGDLNRAEQLVETNPDSALIIVQDLRDKYTQMPGDEKALFGLLYCQLLQKEDEEIPVELIDFSIEYYTNTNQKLRLSYAYLYKGRVFKRKRRYGEAIQNYLKALEYVDNKKDDTLLGKVYFDLGQIATYQNESDKALEYFKQSGIHLEKANEVGNLAKVYLVMGLLYQAINDFDASIRFSIKALEATTDSTVMGDVMNGIGSSYYFKEQPDSALYYIRQSLRYPYYSTNKSQRLYNLSNVYTFLNQYDSALVYVNQALQLPIDIYIEEECYRVLINIAIAKDDKANLPKYISLRQACMDSIRHLEQQPNINLLEQLYQSGIKTEEVEYQRLYLIFAIAVLLLIGAIIFARLHNHNRRKQHQANTYKIELEKKHELLLSELYDELEHTRAKYAEVRKKGNFEQREQIEKTIYNEVLHVDDEKAFTDKMNRVLNRLPEKLKSDYTDITYKEILWCCLFILQFSTSDISLIMDYKQSSQYKFKQRLSKKLNLNTAKDLEEMLHQKVSV